ncbi:alpha-ketoglutarate-dependent dioxygenase alkB homolog 4 [Rhynchophorus ferrugineus]|uniref:Fe2OG dioxygenase domain-containing protein n=1 Tax=Rhynchophorus ferrugineus TaxID=354439 RepID=A0A834LZK8_RHYFE|nr:hypothetical protein GWI33_021536 [Rhynchophorus ferrugineus]
MDKPRPCGCKGRRTCLICEADFQILQDVYVLDPNASTYVFCPYCNLCFPGWDMNLYKKHPNHEGQPIKCPGVYVHLEFLSNEEHDDLIESIDRIPWDLSQSGRRKQNYGPKCNFRKRKLRMGNFSGFPFCTKFIQDKFLSVPIMEGFQTIEQCSLEYDPKKGASIDPHVDDCWIWGERVVTVNLLSDSVLTLTFNQKPDKYNIDLVSTYRRILDHNGKFIINTDNWDSFHVDFIKPETVYPIIRVPMPRNSLIVMYGNARYNYEHRVLREDITERRVCLAYREFTPPYLEGGEFYEEGKPVIQKAKHFFETDCEYPST